MRFSCSRSLIWLGVIAAFFCSQAIALADHEGEPHVPTASQVPLPGGGLIDLSSDYSPFEQLIFGDLINRFTRTLPVLPGQEKIIRNRNLEKLFNGFVQWPIPTDTAPFRIPPAGKQENPPVLTEDHVKPGHFIFSHNSCSPISDRYGNFVFRALRGSLYAVEGNGRFNLMRGRLYVVSSKNPVTVITETGRTVFRPGSSGVIETTAKGTTRIYALTGDTRTGATVQVANRGKFTRDLNPGMEAIIASGRTFGRNAAADGIARIHVKNAEGLPAGVRLNLFSLDQMVAYDSMLDCEQTGLIVSAAKKALIDARQALAKQCELQDGFPDAPSKVARAIKPDVSNVKEASTTAGKEKEEYKPVVNEKGRLVLMDADAFATLDKKNSLTLKSGTIFVRSRKPFTVRAGGKSVRISKKACVLVCKKAASLKIINLSDLKRKSVAVIAGGKSMYLKPGREVIFTTDPPSIGHLFDIHQVGHAGTVARLTAENEWVTSSNVSLNDSLKFHPLLSMLRKNGTSKGEKKTVGHILKTAAALQHIYGPEVDYVRGQPGDGKAGTKRIAAKCNNCLN